MKYKLEYVRYFSLLLTCCGLYSRPVALEDYPYLMFYVICSNDYNYLSFASYYTYKLSSR